MEVKHFIEVSSEKLEKFQNIANLLRLGVHPIQCDDLKFLKNLKIDD